MQWIFVAVYLATPLLIIYSSIRLARSQPRRPVWPMPVALG